MASMTAFSVAGGVTKSMPAIAGNQRIIIDTPV